MQSEDGYLTTAGIAFCAAQLDLTEAEVTAVATFYSMYRRTPTGEYLVGVCTNTLCAIMGGDAILDALQDHLGVHAGETTDDGRVTLEHIECNAACDYAPVVMVNWEFFDNQTPSSARDLVDALRAGQPPRTQPRRAAVHVPGDRTHPRRPARRPPGDRRRTGAHGATLAGLRVARELGMEAPPPPDGDATRRHRSPTAPSRGRRDHQGRTGTGTVGHRACRSRHHRNRPEHNGFTRLTWHLLLP